MTRGEQKLKYFIVLGTIRSGSSLVSTQISSHPNISMPNDEIILPNLLLSPLSQFTYGKNSKIEELRSPKHFFESISGINATPTTAAAGIKSAIYELDDWKRCLKTLREHLLEVSVVAVIRDNILDVIGSASRAAKTGTWHKRTAGSDNNEQFKTFIDPLSFSNDYTRFRTIIDDIRSLKSSHRYFEVSYEEDIALNSDYLDRLFEWLRIPASQFGGSELRKISPPARDYIKNYDSLCDLEEKLRKTPVPLTPTLSRRLVRWISRKGLL